MRSLPSRPGRSRGTVQVVFIATGLVGTLSYLYSGELREHANWRLTTVLSGASIVGALAGAFANPYVSRTLFGYLLGGLAIAAGGLIIYREHHGLTSLLSIDVSTRRGGLQLAGLGVVLGALSGLLGVGGPVVAVPTLVLVGVPMLHAVAVAQVQSVFIAGFASVGYLLQGTVSYSLVGVVGVPLVVGVLLGWQVARRVEPARLKGTLGGVLLIVGPYLAFG